MGDRIAILDEGVLQQVGAAAGGVRASPRTCSSPRFIGNPPMNTRDGHGRDATATAASRSQLPGGERPAAGRARASGRAAPRSTTWSSGVRPEHLRARRATGRSRPTVSRRRVARPRAPRRLPARRRQMVIVRQPQRRRPSRRGRDRAARRGARARSTSSTPSPGSGSTDERAARRRRRTRPSVAPTPRAHGAADAGCARRGSATCCCCRRS